MKKTILSTLVATLILPWVAAGATVRTVALSGNPAPGASSGAIFERFDVPALNRKGQAAFSGTFRDDPSTTALDGGIWSEGHGSLALVAKTGQQAPGTEAGVRFRGFVSPAFNSAGDTAFYGSLAGGYSEWGIWSEVNGTLHLVTRQWSLAPGIPHSRVFDFTSYYFHPVVNSGGQTAFYGRFTQAGATFTAGDGIWLAGSGGPALIAGYDTHPSGYANDLRFQSFTFFPALNDNGQVAFEATMTGGDGERIHAVWMGGVDSLALVARNGDRAPGTPEGVHFAGFDDPKLNSVGQIAFRGYYSDSETTDIVGSGVWAGSNEALRLVASSDMHIPGTPEGITPGGFNLGNFNRLTMNSAGRVAFFAILSGGGDDSGIWSEGFGSLALVALAGDHAPGTPPEVEFADFGYGRAVLNAAGQTAFYTTLRGPGLTQSSASGIWAQDRKGNLHLVVRGGDQLEVAPGDIRTVAGAGFMAGSGNDDGSPSGFNDRGQLAFVAYFTDGSQGVFVSDVVAIPEPASLLLSGFIAAMAVRRGRLPGLRPGAYFCELER